MSKLQLLAKLFLWFVFPAGRKEEKKKKPSSHPAESVRACSTRVSIPFFRASPLHLVWFFCAQVGGGHSYLGEKGAKGEPAVIEPVSLQNGLACDHSRSAESFSA